MSRILAYKCKGCSSLFEDEKDYRSHIRKEAAANRAWRKETQKQEEWAAFLAEPTFCSSFEEIGKWFVDNGERIIKKCSENRSWDRAAWRPGDGIISIEFSRMTWSESCGAKNLPTGYPGWTGFVRIAMSPKFNLGCDVFKETAVHTGSGGGGGGGKYDYQVTIFAEEFLALFTMEKLKGNLNGRT